MADIFISYKSEDRDSAAVIASELQRMGLSVWWDRHIPAGRTYDEVIEEALHAARCVVVLWSAHSVGSDWVKTEAAEGASRDILVPVLIDAVDPPLEFKRIHAADLSNWTGDRRDPEFLSLKAAIDQKLSRARTPAAAAVAGLSSGRHEGVPLAEKWSSRRLLQVGGAVALLAVAITMVVFLRDGGGELTRDEAERELGELVADIQPSEDLATRKASISFEELVPELKLPPINQFPLVVTSNRPGSATVEIFVSTEKSGSGTDSWMVEVAEAFNRANLRLEGGQLAQVEIRKIASGTGYEFIGSGRHTPHAFSPSNHLWIEMARARGTVMSPVSDQLVSNLAGLVLKTDTADELVATYGNLDASTLIQAVNDGNLPMAYTDPFASSTGLNFLSHLLLALGGGDMLVEGVDEALAEFQQNVPYVALTTLQIRDSVVAGGQLDAFVMEYQTFVNTEELKSGYEFIPFGISHDNPLYAVGNVSDREMEVLELFAAFAGSPENVALARDFGFAPPAYTSMIDIPSGADLIAAQNLWKTEKDGGDIVTAVFVTDVSGSMEGSRIDAVQNALIDGMAFISEENFVGLVTFNQRASEVLPIRQFEIDQKRLFKGAAEDLSVGGGTAMYDGIATGLQMLVDEQAERGDIKPVVIVLTDGESQDGHVFDDLAPLVKGLGIPVYTIGFEADLEELGRISSLVEAASINASEDDVIFRIQKLFNAQL